MAYRIMSNKKNGKITILFSGTAGVDTVIVAGNNTVSNIALPGEIVTGAEVTAAFYSTGATANATHAPIQIDRAANAAITFFGSGHFERQGMALNLDPEANVVVSRIGNSTTLILELDKNTNDPSVY